MKNIKWPQSDTSKHVVKMAPTKGAHLRVQKVLVEINIGHRIQVNDMVHRQVVTKSWIFRLDAVWKES